MGGAGCGLHIVIVRKGCSLNFLIDRVGRGFGGLMAGIRRSMYVIMGEIGLTWM